MHENHTDAPRIEPKSVYFTPDADACGRLGCQSTELLFSLDGVVVCADHVDAVAVAGGDDR